MTRGRSAYAALVGVLALLGVGDGVDASAQPPPVVASSAQECVVLLHGLARTPRSMRPLARYLEAAGYSTVTPGYPSRKQPIVTLAATVLPAALAACRDRGAGRIHFVTHSLGGILVRVFFQGLADVPRDLGRVVMLAPPNQGSEVVDKLRKVPGYGWLNGPAGQALGTGAEGIAARLGPVRYPVGVIAGSATVNPILSLLIPGPDDGKVAVDRTRVAGMADHLIVPHSHPFIMGRPAVMAQVVVFLQQGRFQHP